MFEDILQGLGRGLSQVPQVVLGQTPRLDNNFVNDLLNSLTQNQGIIGPLARAGLTLATMNRDPGMGLGVMKAFSQMDSERNKIIQKAAMEGWGPEQLAAEGMNPKGIPTVIKDGKEVIDFPVSVMDKVKMQQAMALAARQEQLNRGEANTAASGELAQGYGLPTTGSEGTAITKAGIAGAGFNPQTQEMKTAYGPQGMTASIGQQDYVGKLIPTNAAEAEVAAVLASGQGAFSYPLKDIPGMSMVKTWAIPHETQPREMSKRTFNLNLLSRQAADMGIPPESLNGKDLNYLLPRVGVYKSSKTNEMMSALYARETDPEKQAKLKAMIDSEKADPQQEINDYLAKKHEELYAPQVAAALKEKNAQVAQGATQAALQPGDEKAPEEQPNWSPFGNAKQAIPEAWIPPQVTTQKMSKENTLREMNNLLVNKTSAAQGFSEIAKQDPQRAKKLLLEKVNSLTLSRADKLQIVKEILSEITDPNIDVASILDDVVLKVK